MTNSPIGSLLHGITNLIASLPNVSDIEMEKSGSCSLMQIMDWEKKNGVLLPVDIKNFFQVSDGLVLRWFVKVPEGKSVRVGRIEINSLNRLEEVAVRDSITGIGIDLNSCVNCLQLIPAAYSEVDAPQLGSQNWKVYRLSSDECGTVCLVFKKKGTEVSGTSIWLLDPALTWYKLTGSFTAYFRLLLVHFGLPDFQLFYTGKYGPRASSMVWYRLFVPGIINTFHAPSVDNDEKILTHKRVPFDRNKAFKTVLNDKKKQAKAT